MMALVIGASSSGKSALAEGIAMRQAGESLIYLATMRHGGAETEQRIARHREMRSGRGFVTVERALDVGQTPLPGRAVCLLECLSNLLANEMYDRTPPPDLAGKLARDVLALRDRTAALVVVSNEVFSDGAQYDPFCTAYIETLGALNAMLAREADTVIESVAGLPFYLKGGRL